MCWEICRDMGGSRDITYMGDDDLKGYIKTCLTEL